MNVWEDGKDKVEKFVKPLVLMGADWGRLIDAFRAYTDLGDGIASLARLRFTEAETARFCEQRSAILDYMA